jgi:hypothetical protein
MNWVLLALPVVLVLVWLARGWFVARKKTDLSLPRELP